MNGRCEGDSFTSADAEGLLRHRNSKINTDMGTKMLLYAACAITTGTTTLNTGQSPISKFERTVGPVSKGFSASFSIDTGTGTVMPLRIECRKDDGPFVVKVESNNRASYVIE